MIVPGIAPMYVRRWPRISASSRTPPTERRANLRPSARAIDWPSDVLPTPGGPTKQRIWPEVSFLQLRDGEVLDDPLLHLLEVEVVLVEHLLRAARGRGCPRSSCPTAASAIQSRYVRMTPYSAAAGGSRSSRAELAVGRLARRPPAARAPRAARAAPSSSACSGSPSPSSSWIAFSCWRRKNSRWPFSISDCTCDWIFEPSSNTSSSRLRIAETSRSRCLDVGQLEQLLLLLGLQAQRRGDEVAERARVVDVRRGELQLLGQVRDEADDRARRGSGRCGSAPRARASPRARRAARRTRRRGTGRPATGRSSWMRRRPWTRMRSVPSGTRIILWTTAAVPIS